VEVGPLVRLKELQNRLFEAVDKRVGPYGYAHRAKTQNFYKDTNFGRLSLHLALIKHPPEFAVAADVAVRFEALEDLLSEFREDLSEAEKRNTFSLGAELGNIAGVGYTKLGAVAGEKDIEHVADTVLTAFETVGLPYLEKFSDVEAALDAYSGDDRASWLHSPLHGVRANDAIGLAFLLGRREKFFQLAAAKTEFLTARKEEGLNLCPDFAPSALQILSPS
jgi:hypothetical protein